MNCRNQFIKWKLSKDQTSDQHFSLCLTEKEPQTGGEPPQSKTLEHFPKHTHRSLSSQPSLLGKTTNNSDRKRHVYFKASYWVDLANDHVFLPICKHGIRHPTKCHLPLLCLNHYMELWLQNWKSGGFGGCLFGFVVYLVLFNLPCMFVSMLFWYCIKKSMAFGIRCTRVQRFRSWLLPLPAVWLPTHGLTSLHLNFLIVKQVEKYLLCKVDVNCRSAMLPSVLHGAWYWIGVQDMIATTVFNQYSHFSLWSFIQQVFVDFSKNWGSSWKQRNKEAKQSVRETWP